MAKKYLDDNGLLYLWGKIKALFVQKETGKGLSTNDYTTAEKNKLAGIASGAEVNVQSDWNAVSGDAQILNKPTKLSDFTNDSGFITSASVPSATTTTPKMDGTASVGSETKYAKGDHVHPHDTTKVDKVEGKGLSTNDFTDADKTKLDGMLEDTNIRISSKTDSGDSAGHLYGFYYELNGQGATDYFYDTDYIDSMGVQMMTALGGKVNTSAVGQASGVCPLDANSKIDAQYLPSYVDDVIEAYPVSGATELSAGWLSETSGGSALTPASGVIYVLMADTTNYATNTQFRWATNTYVKLNDGGVTAITNGEIDTIVAS